MTDRLMRETDCNLLFQNELKDIAKIIEEIKEQYTSEFETCSYEVKNLGGNWILKKYIFSEMKTKLEGM